MFTTAILSAALWQTTWFAAPQPAWDSAFILPTNVPATLSRQSVREVVRTSVGGRQLRVQFSNRYGSTPLTIGTVRVGLLRDGGRSDPASERALTFNGSASVVVPPGAPVLSDPIDFALEPLAHLAITTFFPVTTPVHTFHWGDQQTAQLGAGTVPAQPVKGRLFLSSVLVDADPAAQTVITLGDSITDGNGSTPDADRRWPDLLAQRLAPQGVAVANAGISGARLLGDKMGANALARFGQDVLAHQGRKTVIVLLGINDIGWPASPFAPDAPAVSAEQLIAGYRQLVTLARAHQVRIVGATLPPFEGALSGTPFAGHFSRQKDRVRMAVNQWLRTAGAFDALIDFDAVLRDPAHPARLLPEFDSGDHLHPGDAGYQAMADAVFAGRCFDHNGILTNCLSGK